MAKSNVTRCNSLEQYRAKLFDYQMIVEMIEWDIEENNLPKGHYMHEELADATEKLEAFKEKYEKKYGDYAINQAYEKQQKRMSQKAAQRKK